MLQLSVGVLRPEHRAVHVCAEFIHDDGYAVVAVVPNGLLDIVGCDVLSGDHVSLVGNATQI